jgi:predicted secreted protein
MNSVEVNKHRRRGSMRAQRALRDANVDFEAPIDVFGAIEDEQVWLLFQPLDRLYGAYRRHDTPGIVIHSGHPHRLQRFTAAHELGHHLLGHDISVDAHDEVEQPSAGLPAQEIEAQAFASTFLMPVQLVNRGLAHIGLQHKPGSITPEEAYRLSLDLGSSYMATVTQLRALDRITFGVAQDLLKVSPITIKTALAAGQKPANARADVWALTRGDDGRRLAIGLDDEVHVSLEESPTTGYRWRPTPDVDELQIVGDEPLPQQFGDESYGAERLRHLWWRAMAPTEAALAADLRRGFDADAIADRFEVTVQVEPARTGDADHGVSRRQLQLA